MGILKRKREGKAEYGVSRRLPPNKLGMKRYRRWFEKKALAEKVLGKINNAIATGEIDSVLPALVGAADESQTISRFYERFESEYCKPRLSSWTRYRQSFRFLLPKIGNIRIGEFTRGDLHEYLERRTKDVSQATANRDTAALKKMFAFAVEVGLMEYNPIAGFHLFKVQEKPVRVPTIDEFHTLVEAQATPQMRALVAIYGETGMRRNEALNLTWRDIDLVRQKVIATKTKGKRTRGIPLSDFTVQKLRELTRIVGNPYVFVYDMGRNFGKKMVKPYDSFRSAAKSVGLEWVTFHVLRDYRATNWLQHGADIRDVQIGLGHVSIVTTQRYLKHTETSVDRSLRQAQEREKKEHKSETVRDKSGTQK
jgi:integrase